jgi:hypothetical protein
MIGIGVQLGGPEQRDAPIAKILARAGIIAEALRASDYADGSHSWINPIFIVPGAVSKPDFEGYKLGHFSRKKKGLVVMIAVPESVAHGEAVPEFIIISLRNAVEIANNYFKSKKMTFEVLETERMIDAIEAGLREFCTLH